MPLVARRLRLPLISTLLIGAFAFLARTAARGAPLLVGDWARYSVLTPAGPAEPSSDVLKRLHPLVWVEHKIQPNEWNIWKLAKNYGTSVPALQATNNNELIFINPGL